MMVSSLFVGSVWNGAVRWEPVEQTKRVAWKRLLASGFIDPEVQFVEYKLGYLVNTELGISTVVYVTDDVVEDQVLCTYLNSKLGLRFQNPILDGLQAVLKRRRRVGVTLYSDGKILGVVLSLNGEEGYLMKASDVYLPVSRLAVPSSEQKRILFEYGQAVAKKITGASRADDL